MRKKIEELRNKEDGFTLVELLAVIVILGIIVAIAIPSVGGIVNKANTDAQEAEKGLIIDATQLYVADQNITETGTVDVSTLVSQGYLEELDDESLFKGQSVSIAVTPPAENVEGLPQFTYKIDPKTP